jgi:hypothetical protein
MLIRGVINDEVGDNPDPTSMGLVKELHEIVEIPILRQYRVEVRYVVATVAKG